MLGLPGNPTSAMVTFMVFARPAILKLMGCAHPIPQPLLAVTAAELDNRGGRETFFRVTISQVDGRLGATSGKQDSSMLLPLLREPAA